MAKNAKRHVWVQHNSKVNAFPPPPMQDRPVCPGCLKPRLIKKVNEDEFIYEGFGYFCTLRCATDWANREVATQVKVLTQPEFNFGAQTP